MEKFNELVALVEDAKKDSEQFFNKGNNSAGSRLRQKMMAVKNLASEIRKEVSEIKNADK